MTHHAEESGDAEVGGTARLGGPSSKLTGSERLRLVITLASGLSGGSRAGPHWPIVVSQPIQDNQLRERRRELETAKRKPRKTGGTERWRTKQKKRIVKAG